MKRTLAVLTVALMFCAAPASAQQNELAELKAQLLAQQTAIQQLLDRIAVLEKQQAAAVTKPDLERQEQAQDDAVNSVRETLLGKVNLSGYYNFRAFADGISTAPSWTDPR
jgi:predicted  nucleic acid-binding Zn-ribbon protein